MLIENVPRIIQMRQHKTLMEGDVAPELARAFKGMENNNNPWGIGSDQRDQWALGLDIPRMADLARQMVVAGAAEAEIGIAAPRGA